MAYDKKQFVAGMEVIDAEARRSATMAASITARHAMGALREGHAS